MKPDQQRVSDVVMETIIKLCESGLEGSSARVEGVIAVTVDDSDVFVIHINDTVRNLSAHNLQGMSSVSMSSPTVSMSSPAVSMLSPAVSMSSPGCSSARKRARHRLVFQSPDSSRRTHAELAGSQCKRGLSYNESSQRHADSQICQSAPVSQSPTGYKLTNCDVKPPAAKRSVVVVDSDDEDVKVVVDRDVSQRAVCQETSTISADSKNFVSTTGSFHAVRTANAAINCDMVKGSDAMRRGAGTVKDGDTVGDTGTVTNAGEVADTVSGLCISDVVGSVQSWYNSAPVAAGMSPTVVKDDLHLNSYQADNDDDDDDDDEVTVMEEEECNEMTLQWAKATPPRHLKVSIRVNMHRVLFSNMLWGGNGTVVECLSWV